MDISIYKRIKFLTILCVITLMVSLVALFRFQLNNVYAAITNSSRVIPYQGRLTDSSGNNVADGTYAMTFKIYTVSTGGSASFTETFSAGNAVSVSSGLFSVLLGSLSASGVNLDFANPPYYLGITIAANAEMSPRIQLGFVPLAHNAQYLDGNPASSLVPSGTIAFFATTCPTAWTEYTAARGMYIVGNPSGGTLATAVGTALTNLENRAVGQHNHSITDLGHSHGFNTGANNCCYGTSRVVQQQGTDAGTYSTISTTTGISINNSGSVAGTNAPYIQLTACKKD